MHNDIHTVSLTANGLNVDTVLAPVLARIVTGTFIALIFSVVCLLRIGISFKFYGCIYMDSKIDIILLLCVLSYL